jgi:hypothetical protein
MSASQSSPGFRLSELHDLALELDDRAMAERLLRVVGAVSSLSEQHALDDRGRCRLCRPTRRYAPWRRRHACTVHQVCTTYRIDQPTIGGHT